MKLNPVDLLHLLNPHSILISGHQQEDSTIFGPWVTCCRWSRGPPF